MGDPYPHPQSQAVSDRMRRNGRRDTAPELRLRSLLHRQGLRFRVDLPIKASGVTVRPDIVFTRHRLAVFVDGCFWHHCPEHGTDPRYNSTYWTAKFERNTARDRRADAALADAGWQIIRVWEHEDPEHVVRNVASAIAQTAYSTARTSDAQLASTR